MRMLELPFCFNEYSTQVANSLSCKSAGHGVGAESMVTCTYRTKVAGKPYLMTVTWCRSIGGAGLSLQVMDMSGEEADEEEGLERGSSKAEEEESGGEGDELRSDGGGETAAWVFGGKRKGSKELCWEGAMAVWDMTEARYEGAEPKEGYYFAVVAHGKEVVLMLGDRTAEAEKRVAADGGAAVCWAAETSLVWRREEVVGRRIFALRGARLSSDAAARLHDITIECNWRAAEPRLVVRIDRRTAFHVKKLRWKFRGNQTILVDGSPVELFWDVHDWLFGGGGGGAAVFLFQSAPPLSSSSDRSFSSLASTSTSLFQWHHHSHHHPSSSVSSLKDFDHSGFSLLLYAWKT